MIAAERPQLRGGLRFIRQESGHGIAWIVKDPAARKYFRFGQVEAWLMQNMDGRRSLQDLCDLLLHEAGLRATPAALDVLVRRLKELGLVERSVTERSAMMMEQLRSQRRIRRETGDTLLRMRFSFGDPDALLTRMARRIPFFWTRRFVVASLAFFALYLVVLAAWWTPFSTLMISLYHPAALTLPTLALTYVVFTGVSVVHEFGHGLTCKRFGGEVREMGAMLLYFTPSFYCNISDAWTFEKRSHRLWVTFAGGWIELWIAGAAALVWLGTEPGTAINTLAGLTSATAGALSLLLNYNPLLPLDGYYALVDWLEMPNLRGRSFDYLGALVKRHVLGLDARLPPVTARERRILLGYGSAAAVYTTLLLVVIAVFAVRLLVEHFGGWGGVAAAALLLSLTRRPRAALAVLARAVADRRMRRPGRRRTAALALLLLVAAAALAAAAPWTVRTPAVVTVEPAARVWLRPARDARLQDVRVADGTVVAPGDTLAVLHDAELELAWVAVASRLHEVEGRAALARAHGDLGVLRNAEIEVEVARERLAFIAAQRDELVLRAPVRGTIVTPLLDEEVGATIAAGDTLLELWQDGPLRARLAVPASRGGELRTGAALRVRFPAWPDVTWHAVIGRVETAADGDTLVAFAELPSSPGRPLHVGMKGRGRIDIVRTRVAGAAIRAVRRIVRLDLLL